MKGLIFPLLRFSALIILFQENISLRCKRSCLRLVKKLTGEFMRVNELYFLIEYKILLSKRKTKIHSTFLFLSVLFGELKTHSEEKVGSSSSSAGSQLSMFSLNCRRSLNKFFIVKSQSKKSRRKFFPLEGFAC